jgi:hypothetical protein
MDNAPKISWSLNAKRPRDFCSLGRNRPLDESPGTRTLNPLIKRLRIPPTTFLVKTGRSQHTDLLLKSPISVFHFTQYCWPVKTTRSCCSQSRYDDRNAAHTLRIS